MDVCCIGGDCRRGFGLVMALFVIGSDVFRCCMCCCCCSMCCWVASCICKSCGGGRNSLCPICMVFGDVMEKDGICCCCGLCDDNDFEDNNAIVACSNRFATILGFPVDVVVVLAPPC